MTMLSGVTWPMRHWAFKGLVDILSLCANTHFELRSFPWIRKFTWRENKLGCRNTS